MSKARWPRLTAMDVRKISNGKADNPSDRKDRQNQWYDSVRANIESEIIDYAQRGNKKIRLVLPIGGEKPSRLGTLEEDRVVIRDIATQLERAGYDVARRENILIVSWSVEGL